MSSDESQRACEAFDDIRTRLKQQHAALVDTTRIAAQRAERIRDTADQVLMNLQFQDRMRQVHNAVQREVVALSKLLGISMHIKLDENAPPMSGEIDSSVEAGEIEFF